MNHTLTYTGEVFPRMFLLLCRLLTHLGGGVVLCFIFGTFLTDTAISGATLKSAVDVREGPGSYFPLVARLHPAASVTAREETGGWTHIAIEEVSGWIPSVVLATDSGTADTDNDTGDSFDALRDRFDRAFEDESEPPVPYVSKAQVVAAVKGFIENHIAATGGEFADLSDHLEYHYHPASYQQFRDSRLSEREWRRFKRAHRLSMSGIPYPNPDLDKVGWAAGNRIAQTGIHTDPALSEYLNHIAMLVTESSHRPCLPVRIILLETNDILGYAVPGGLVFVSTGAVATMRTEAEFAAFVGHEIAHLVFRHGETELEKRATRIRADDATRRMDRLIEERGMTDERYREVTRELQQMADDLFEYLVYDRLHDYEEEADYYGLQYALRAGYRGEALFNLLERIAKTDDEPELEKRSAWFGDTMEMRLDALKKNLSKHRTDRGSHHAEAWDSRTRHLRTTQ